MIPPPPFYGPWSHGFWSKAHWLIRLYWAGLIALLPFIAASLFGFWSPMGDLARSMWLGAFIAFGIAGLTWYCWIGYRCIQIIDLLHPMQIGFIEHLTPDVNGAILVVLKKADDEGRVYGEAVTFNVKRDSVTAILRDVIEQGERYND